MRDGTDAASGVSRAKRIVITLPAYFDKPIGGYHVHYEYANRLAEAGHDVTIVFPRCDPGHNRWRDLLRTHLWARRLRQHNRPLVSSYHIHERVKIRLLHDLTAASLPKADVLIATAWQTAEAVQGVGPAHGRKFYIVYDYEHLMSADTELAARIQATYRSPFAIIATSTIVDQTVRQSGGTPVAVIMCGLDLNVFCTETPPEHRLPRSVMFPVRIEAHKGTNDAISAMQILRGQLGKDVQISAFGSQRVSLPDWIDFNHYPSQTMLRALYNRHAVFLVPSYYEGWGLPGIEAMACGAALVTTANGGCSDYADNDRTALVVPPGRPEEMASAVARLFTDHALRLRLAHAGQTEAKRFTWENAASRLEAVLTQTD